MVVDEHAVACERPHAPVQDGDGAGRERRVGAERRLAPLEEHGGAGVLAPRTERECARGEAVRVRVGYDVVGGEQRSADVHAPHLPAGAAGGTLLGARAVTTSIR